MTTKKTYRYRVDAEGTTLVEEVRAKNPAAALREVCGDDLVRQDGRYGTLRDGRHVVALLLHDGRRYLGGHEWGR